MPGRTRFIARGAAAALAAVLAVLPAALPVGTMGAAQAASNPQSLIDNARYTLEKMVRHTDTKAFPDLLRKAQAVLIVPSLLKAGFLLGGEGGTGVLLARENGGRWSHPAFYDVGSGSIGLQFGFQDSEVVFLIMSKRTLTSMLEARIKFGADASVSAGPYGIGYEGSTAINLRADIYSYALSRGAYFGTSFEGSVVVENSGLNRAYYGAGASSRSIVLERRHTNPAAGPLLHLLGAY